MATDEEIGERLRQAREAKGLNSGAEAARTLHIPVPTYNQYENGTRGCRLHASRLARFYNVRLDWLLDGKGPMKAGGKDPISEKFEALTPENQQLLMDQADFLRSRQK